MALAQGRRSKRATLESKPNSRDMAWTRTTLRFEITSSAQSVISKTDSSRCLPKNCGRVKFCGESSLPLFLCLSKFPGLSRTGFSLSIFNSTKTKTDRLKPVLLVKAGRTAGRASLWRRAGPRSRCWRSWRRRGPFELCRYPCRRSWQCPLRVPKEFLSRLRW